MRKILLAILLPATLTGCRPSTTNYFPETISVEVVNPIDQSRRDVPVFIALDNIPEIGAFAVRSNEVQLPAQNTGSGLMLVLDSLRGNEKRTITIYYNSISAPADNHYRKRTQAELSHRFGGQWQNREYVGGEFRNVDHLRVPPEHKDHSWFIRYEGPGWESDKVGYRFYLDQRNAIDVFGKKTSDMVLIGVGQDGFDSYHNMQPWGMDIMKVGKSLGLGSIGTWADTVAMRVELTDSVTCSVKDGDLYSTITTNYFGWKTPNDTIDVESILSIHAGTRFTKHELVVSSNKIPLATGIVKDALAKVYKSEGDKNSWGYIATYGKQSLNNDNLGLVVMFSPSDFINFHEDSNSHVVELQTSDNKLEYYLGAAWELEPRGISSEADFIKWIERSARELANPIIVRIND